MNAFLGFLAAAGSVAGSSNTTVDAVYSQALALKASYLAQAAYCGPPTFSASKLASWECGPACNAVPGMSKVTTVSGASKDAYGYVGLLDGQCIVAFRGTSDLKGWMEDLESGLSTALAGCTHQGADCYVGDGFNSNYNSMAAKVKDALNALDCGPEGVLVVGHSLGAAEAALAMWDLHRSGYHLATGYTFGQPRVGDAAFADAFKAAGIKQWRVTHDRDPVVHLPPEAMEFYHTATEVYYPGLAAGGHTVCDGSGEDDNCADQWWDVPDMILDCLEDDEAHCDHLTYLYNLRSMLLDGTSCTNTHKTHA